NISGGIPPAATASSSSTPVAVVTPTPIARAEEAATPQGNACADVEQWLSDTRDRIQRARSLSDDAATLSNLDLLTGDRLAFDQLASDQAASAFPEAAGPVNKALVATFRGFGDAIDTFVGSADPAAGTSLGESDAMSTIDAANTRL